MSLFFCQCFNAKHSLPERPFPLAKGDFCLTVVRQYANLLIDRY